MDTRAVGVNYPSGERSKDLGRSQAWASHQHCSAPSGTGECHQPCPLAAGGTTCQGLFHVPREPSTGLWRPSKTRFLRATDPARDHEQFKRTHRAWHRKRANPWTLVDCGCCPPACGTRCQPRPSQLLLFQPSSTSSMYICTQGFYPGLALFIRKKTAEITVVTGYAPGMSLIIFFIYIYIYVYTHTRHMKDGTKTKLMGIGSTWPNSNKLIIILPLKLISCNISMIKKGVTQNKGLRFHDGEGTANPGTMQLPSSHTGLLQTQEMRSWAEGSSELLLSSSLPAAT